MRFVVGLLEAAEDLEESRRFYDTQAADHLTPPLETR